jgi:hypothetical protein
MIYPLCLMPTIIGLIAPYFLEGKAFAQLERNVDKDLNTIYDAITKKENNEDAMALTIRSLRA